MDNNNFKDNELNDVLSGLDEVVGEIELYAEQKTIDNIFDDVYASFDSVKLPYEMPVIEEEPVEEAPAEEPTAEPEPQEEETIEESEEEISPAILEEAPLVEVPVEEITQVEPKKRNLLPILLIFVLLIGSLGAWYFNRPAVKHDMSIDAQIKEEQRNQTNSMSKDLRKLWLTNEDINPDYVGEIIFDSGFIKESVVQAKDKVKEDGTPYKIYDEQGSEVIDTTYASGNDVYIWQNWKTGEPVDRRTGIGGSTFIDCREDLSEQLILVYGHHWARDYLEKNGIKEEPNFTALDKLEDKANYEANKTFKFVLDNELREYVVAGVYVMDISNETDITPLINGELSREDIEHVKSKLLYDTGVEMSAEDKYMMLITCKQHNPGHREIVLAKETSREIYE